MKTTIRILTLACFVASGIGPLKGAENAENMPLSKDEHELLELLNAERTKAGLTALKPNPLLFRAARDHSAAMARAGVLAHELDGKSPGDRLGAIGYRSAGWGENCAAGQRSAAEAMSSWMSSPGHRRNILNGEYREVGLGLAKSTNGQIYWTQVFAIPNR